MKERNTFWRYRGSLSMRKGTIKLLTTPEDTMLFDLSTDIGEEYNIAADSLDLLNAMMEELGKWDAEMNKYPQKTR